MATVREILQDMSYGPAPEASNYAQEWLDAHGGKFGCFVGGDWTVPTTTFESYSPSTGDVIAHLAQAGATDVNAAVRAARLALPKWQALSGTQRGKFLYAIARQIQKHSRLFAVLESMDNGKPIRETRDLDIPLVARHFYHHAGWAQLVESEFSGYEPVGVCGQIIPWNFPLLMLAWKIAPALAAGNTVVMKPAEFTSLTAILFAEVCAQVGLPAGVVNIVTGDGETGRLIVEHPDVDKIAFTGSTEVGRVLRKATAGTGKKLSLELGGKSPFIVFEDADQDAAIEGLVDAIWFNQGQVCCAGSRLLVQESIAEKFLAKLRTRMSTLRVGDPLDKAVDIGAIVAPVQLERIDALVKQGVAEGATLFQPNCPMPEKGWFYPPTLLSDVQPSATVAQVEIFGPVLVSMTFRTHAEAIELANNTVYGLASCVWTENLNLAHDVSGKIKAGTVWINCTNQFDAACGFGGYRESGYGREGGREGMYEYLRPILSKPVKSVAKASAPVGLYGGTIDRTHKHYIGGKQARPDGGYSFTLALHGGGTADVARGNRKDIRNAVEVTDAAAKTWAGQTAHMRAQILYYLAENLEAEADLFVRALAARGAKDARREFDASVERCLFYAAWADKYDGQVHTVPMRCVVLTRNEPLGPVGVVCPDEAPLLGLLSTALPLIAMGNSVVAIPSEVNPLPACELYRVLDASDVPGGVFNIVTGTRSELVKTLAEHDTLAALWHFGDADTGAEVESMSVGNLKQTWCTLGKPMDWYASPPREFLRRATQVKNIWVPYGA